MSNRLQDWNAKTIITCRSQALYSINDYEKFFMLFHRDKRQSHLLTQAYVAPFSENQIAVYLQQYAALKQQTIQITKEY